MVCNNKNNRLLMEVKSGESRGFGFTIKQLSGQDEDGNNVYEPMKLTDYQVVFEVKRYPYNSVEPLISKTLTTEVDNYTGWILDQDEYPGQFQIQLTADDLDNLVPEQQYYVILTLVNGDTKIIISGEGDTSGILRFCQS